MEQSLQRRDVLLGAAGVGLVGSATSATRTVADQPGHERDTAAVVSQHHLATEAGVEVLSEGGTAADAAIAVASALSVVEPWFSSALGGGTWALYYDTEADQVTSLDGVGPVGAEATPEDFEERADESGMHQAVVPGAWDGWMRWLDRYGVLELDEILAPAIRFARDGYPVSPEMEGWLVDEADLIAERPAASAIYQRNGELVAEGDTVYQHGMADTFESLVDAYETRRDVGRPEAIQAASDHFYRGPIAETIVTAAEERGGYLTRPDFESFEAEIVEPLSIQYDDHLTVYQNPPNSQGITQLLALNVLKEYDLSRMDDTDAVHVQAEGIKLAFADRNQHVGDPDRVDVPISELLDEDYASEQGDRIAMDDVMEWPIESGLSETDGTDENLGDADHTTTFHVVDADGNAAAVTTSLGAQFLVIGETGIHINNRMRMLAIEENDPNRLTPGYKVRHTSNPFMALRDGVPYIAGGTTGVDTQPQGQTQQFVHVTEFDRTAQEAVDHPRFVSTAFPSTQYPYDVENTLQIETAFSDHVIDDLEARGHDVQRGAGMFGTANMIVIGADGLEVGAEPRHSTADGSVFEPSD